MNLCIHQARKDGAIPLREIKRKSSLPIYGMAGICLLYALFLPLYKLSHFIILALVLIAVYFILSKIFPGRTEYEEIPEAPVETGNPALDALLKEGNTAVAEMQRLRDSIGNSDVRHKISQLMDITDLIFKDAAEDPDDIPQIRRFASYFLPTTIKLLHAYDRMGAQGIEGENISGTCSRIETVLDTTIEAYKKQLDSLFQNQALDIETDITVLENMLKAQGLTGKDFQ